MQSIFAVALFIHVLSAIALFGPIFAFPLIGASGAREPMHGNFALRLNELIESRMTMVGIVVQPISGIVAIWAADIDFFAPASRWLVAAIILYAIDVSLSMLIQVPTLRKMVALTGHPPAIGSATAAAAGGPGAAPAGPPPEFLALAKRLQMNGGLMALILVVIIFLMVVKPGV